MTELRDFEHRVGEELARTVESLNPPTGAVERAIDAARAGVEPRHLRVRGGRHWILPMSAAAAALVIVSTVALVSQSSLGTGPAGSGTSPRSTFSPPPSVRSVLPSPSVSPSASHTVAGAPAVKATATGHDAATESVVIRPVDRAGRPAAGYTVILETNDVVDCGPFAEPSPVAVSANIRSCSPSASFAVACWEAADPSHALCFRNPWSRQLAEMSMTPSSQRGTTPLRQPQPLGLLLSDGDHCLIRDGGSWINPVQQPTWFGFYTCARNGAIWGPGHAEGNLGIDRSTPIWTVQVGSGYGPLSVRRVITAYFVGTKLT